MASTSHLDYGRQLIVEALELEKQDRLGEALACYRSGIQALLNHIQVEPGSHPVLSLLSRVHPVPCGSILRDLFDLFRRRRTTIQAWPEGGGVHETGGSDQG
eukprot:m.198235 g.198235  ORF g.198235 m.198235 type:complete len:102 (+) comp53783_c0_seq4:383-688(+)